MRADGADADDGGADRVGVLILMAMTMLVAPMKMRRVMAMTMRREEGKRRREEEEEDTRGAADSKLGPNTTGWLGMRLSLQTSSGK